MNARGAAAERATPRRPTLQAIVLALMAMAGIVLLFLGEQWAIRMLAWGLTLTPIVIGGAGYLRHGRVTGSARS